MMTPDESSAREAARNTDEGRLLVRYGFEPYDTESAARTVARQAVQDINVLNREIALLRRNVDRLDEKVALYERLLKQRDEENAETLDAAVNIETERNSLRRAAGDFIENVRRHNIAGAGEWHTCTDASFRELRTAYEPPKPVTFS